MTFCENKTNWYYSLSRNVSSTPFEHEQFCRGYHPHDSTEFRLDTKVLPVIICILFVTNIFICIVLTRRHMITPTNIILLGMAISDMLTGLSPLPIYIIKNLDFYVTNWSIAMAYTKFILTLFFPTVFHTASIWLTVVLAVQRFIYISLPTRARSICTIGNSVKTTAIVYLVSVSFHAQLLSSTFENFESICEDGERVQLIMKCDWSGHTPMIAYYWIRTGLMHVLPCTALTVFTLLLVGALHRAVRKRRQLFNTPKAKTSRSKSETVRRESFSTSQMLLVVVAIFLVAELPNGVVITLYTCKMMLNLEFKGIAEETWDMMTTVCNIALLVSYPINFFVYCAMSTQFRETFKTLFGIESQTKPLGNNAALLTSRMNTPPQQMTIVPIKEVERGSAFNNGEVAVVLGEHVHIEVPSVTFL